MYRKTCLLILLVALGRTANAGIISFSDSLTDATSAGINNSVTYTAATTAGSASATVGGVSFKSLADARSDGDISVDAGVLSSTFPNVLSGWNPMSGGVAADMTGLLQSGLTNPHSQWSFNNLTAGQSYRSKVFLRTWNPAETRRLNRLVFTNGTEVDSALVSTDTPTDNNAVHGTSYATNHDAFFVAYDFTAQGTSVTLDFQIPTLAEAQAAGFSPTGNPFTYHLYGLSNEETLTTTASVPEPSAMILFSIASLFLFRRRGMNRRSPSQTN